MRTESIPHPSLRAAEPGSRLSYDGDSGGSFTHSDRTEPGSDELGKFVDEVSVVTTTVTTRKRYRVKDA